MFLAFVVASLLFYAPGVNSNPTEISIYWLLLAASALMVIVHAYDDVKGLKPATKLIAQTIAVIIVIGPWIPTFRGVLLYTFSNPFYHFHIPWLHEPNIYLFMQHADFSFVAIPAVLLTWFWIVGMMNTVNLIDGLDGLATGVVGITALFITIISFLLGQQSIAILSAVFTGAVFGFLPHNWNPAKIFMGDSGSMPRGTGFVEKPFTVDSGRLAGDPGRVIRAQDGRPRATDGPYSETKEVLGGFYTIEAANYEEAVARALDHPHLEYGGTMEVRQIWQM